MKVVSVNCAFHCSPQIIISGVRSGDRGGQIILSLSTSRSNVTETRIMYAVAPSSWKYPRENSVSIKMSNERGKGSLHNSVPSAIEEYGADYLISSYGATHTNLLIM
jgi:hypothetical protein